MIDNYRFDLTTDDRHIPLDEAIQFLLKGVSQSNPVPLVGYRIKTRVIDLKEPEEVMLILYWSRSSREGYLEFPYPMSGIDVAPIAMNWLYQKATYPSRMDIDGSSRKGYRVFNETWGHVDGEWEAIGAIEPKWAYYHK